jgi:hypothetical protein
MNDADQIAQTEPVVTAVSLGQAGPGAAPLSANSIQLAPAQPGLAGAGRDTIQTQPPDAKSGWDKPKKSSLKRRLLIGAGALFVLYVLYQLFSALLGWAPCEYTGHRVAGRPVSGITSCPSPFAKVDLFSPGEARIETWRTCVIIHDDVIDLGQGRTIAIPGWCQEVRVSVAAGSVSVTFKAP